MKCKYIYYGALFFFIYLFGYYLLRVYCFVFLPRGALEWSVNVAFHGHTHSLTERQMSGMNLQLSMSAKVDDICN